jgi:hypothetical protein
MFERALTLADTLVSAGTLPADSLVLATLQSDLVFASVCECEMALPGSESRCEFLTRALAWRADTRAVALSQRLLATLTARWHAGALYTLTPAEHAFADEMHPSVLPMAVAELLFTAAPAMPRAGGRAARRAARRSRRRVCVAWRLRCVRSHSSSTAPPKKLARCGRAP